MIFRPAESDDQEQIANMLRTCDLPANDLTQHLNNFIVAEEDGRIIGCIGLELEGPLLRSLAVDPGLRNRGIAHQLCGMLLDLARKKGTKQIYLLTETASGFFEKCGFIRLDRSEAPDPIKNHRQFTELCPSSAILMRKQLEPL